MSLLMNNYPIVSKQYQGAFQLSKYRTVSIFFRYCISFNFNEVGVHRQSLLLLRCR